jgi:hypothetical protein
MSEEKRAAPQLAPQDLQEISYVSTRHDAKIAQGVSIEDLKVPAFWAHHAVRLRPMDEIRARAEDGTWVAYLLVLDASRTWARVKVLTHHLLGTADVSLTQAAEEEVRKLKDGYKVSHRGPHRWSVVRKLDNQVMSEGLAQREDADHWLDRYVREQVSAPPPEATVPA